MSSDQTRRRKYHPVDFGEPQWRRLLEFALQRADRFQCAVPYPYVVQDIQAAPLWPGPLEHFREDLTDRHVSLIRWGLARDEPTQFLTFRLSAGLAGYIRDAGALDEWTWEVGRPEDPVFLRGNNLILSTESADGRIAVYADPADVDRLSAAGVRLLEPLGVEAEPWPTP